LLCLYDEPALAGLLPDPPPYRLLGPFCSFAANLLRHVLAFLACFSAGPGRLAEVLLL